MRLHWSLRARLIGLAVGASLTTAVIGAFAIWSSDRVADRMGAMQAKRVTPLVQLDIVGRRLERQRAAVLATLAATNDLMQEALEKQAERDARELPEAIAALRNAAPEAAEALLLQRLESAIAASRDTGLKPVLEHLRQGRFIEADVAAQSLYRPRMEVATATLDELIRLNVELAERDYQAAASMVRRQAWLTAGATLMALMAGLGLAIAISRSLGRILGADEKDLAHGAREIARGLLQHRIRVRADDRSSVAASLNTMSEGFGVLVADVAASARFVASTAEQLAGAGGDLAGRTSGQASSLEETAASMQQLAATVRQNSERAAHAREIAESAERIAAKGGVAMAEVAATMQGIEESSRRIGEIVGVIDSIAFQTNILALNAAVEAARAGEQGRGFAVVAAEVRSLSQRSAGAAQEIRALIAESVQRSRAGSERVGEANTTIQAIVATTRDVTGTMHEIAAASREQSAGITQVNGALEHLEGVTQHNAALAAQTAANAKEMSSQAEALVESIARFDGEGAGREAYEAIRRAAAPLPAQVVALEDFAR